MNPSVQQRVRSSVVATMGATFASALIQVTTMVILARLLGPTDYGFYIVALSINALSSQFIASAIERAMVIETDAGSLEGRAVPTMLLIAGVSACAFAITASIAMLTDWSIDLGVLAVVLAGQTISGLATTPRALLRREIRFGPIAASELVSLFLGNLLTAGVLAWLGFGPHALAIAFVVQSLVATAWMIAMAPSGLLAPRFRRLGNLPATVFGVLKPATIEAAHGQISPLVVSAVLGPVHLGLFNRVYNLSTLPIQLLVSSVNRVIISTLVTVAEDVDRRRNAAELMTRAGSTMITPVAFGLAGSGASFILVVLGPKWIEASPIVPFLAVAVWANMLGSLLGQLAEATQRFNEKMRVQALSTVSLIVLLLVCGHLWGLQGIGIGVMAAALIFLALYLTLVARILEIPLGRLLGWLAPGTIAGIGCFAASHMIGWALATRAPIVTLSAQIIACGLVASAILIVLDCATLLRFSKLMLPSRLDTIASRWLARAQR